MDAQSLGHPRRKAPPPPGDGSRRKDISESNSWSSGSNTDEDPIPAYSSGQSRWTLRAQHLLPSFDSGESGPQPGVSPMVLRSSKSSTEEEQSHTAARVIEAVTAAAARADAALTVSEKESRNKELEAMQSGFAAAVLSSSSSSPSLSLSTSTDKEKRVFPVDDELIGLLEEREKLKDLLKPGNIVISHNSIAGRTTATTMEGAEAAVPMGSSTMTEKAPIITEAKATAKRWQQNATGQRRSTLDMDASLFQPHVTMGSTLKHWEGESDNEALTRLKRERDFLLERLAEEEARGERILKIKEACEAERARRMREEVDAEMSRFGAQPYWSTGRQRSRSTQLMNEILSSTFASRWKAMNEGRHFLQGGNDQIDEEEDEQGLGMERTSFVSYREEWEARSEEQPFEIASRDNVRVVNGANSTSPIAKAREAWNAEMEEQDKILTHAEKLLSGAEQAIARMHKEDEKGGVERSDLPSSGVGGATASGGGGSDALQQDVLLPAPGAFSNLAAMRMSLRHSEAQPRPSRVAPTPIADDQDGNATVKTASFGVTAAVIEHKATNDGAETIVRQHALQAATAAATLISAASERKSINDYVTRALASQPLTLSKIINPALTLSLQSFYDSTPYPGNASIAEIREMTAALRSNARSVPSAKERTSARIESRQEQQEQQEQQQQSALVPNTAFGTTPGWVELVEPRTMRKVFFNASMNETRWDSPAGPTFRASQGHVQALQSAMPASIPSQDQASLALHSNATDAKDEDKMGEHDEIGAEGDETETPTAAEAAAIAEKAIELHNIKVLARERAKEIAEAKRERFSAAARKLKEEAIGRERKRKERKKAASVLSRFARVVKLRLGLRRYARRSVQRVKAAIMLQSLWRQFLAKRDLHYRLETMRTIMDLEHEGDSDQAMRSEGHRNGRQTGGEDFRYATPERPLVVTGGDEPGSARITFTLRRQQGATPSSAGKGKDGFHYAVVPSPKSPSGSPLRGSFGVFLERRSMIRALVRGFRVRRALKCKRFAVLKSQIEDSLQLLNEVERENGGDSSSSDAFADALRADLSAKKRDFVRLLNSCGRPGSWRFGRAVAHEIKRARGQVSGTSSFTNGDAQVTLSSGELGNRADGSLLPSSSSSSSSSLVKTPGGSRRPRKDQRRALEAAEGRRKAREYNEMMRSIRKKKKGKGKEKTQTIRSHVDSKREDFEDEDPYDDGVIAARGPVAERGIDVPETYAAEEAKDEESKAKRKGPFKFLRRNQGKLAGNQSKTEPSSRGQHRGDKKETRAPRWGHVKSKVSSRLNERQQTARREASRRRREERLEELQRAKRTARSLQERLRARDEERRYVQAREARERQLYMTGDDFPSDVRDRGYDDDNDDDLDGAGAGEADSLDGGEDYYRRREMYNTRDASRRDVKESLGASDTAVVSDPNASRLVISELEEEIAQMSRRDGGGLMAAAAKGKAKGNASYESPRKGNRFADGDPGVNALLGSLFRRDDSSRLPQLGPTSRFFDTVPYGQRGRDRLQASQSQLQRKPISYKRRQEELEREFERLTRRR